MSPATDKRATGRIVEVIGPPGVGKSTIYKALCKTWSPEMRWIHQDALLAPPKPAFRNFDKWVEYKLRTILGKRRAKSIPVDFGLRFINNHEQLASFCWHHLSSSGIPANREMDKRYKSAYFLFSDFCRYQAILESGASRPCLIEEGFLQKSFAIHEDESALTAFLAGYLPVIPLPHAVIYVDVKDTALITERLQNRSKLIATHLGKDTNALVQDVRNWQQTLEAMLDGLEKRNVMIYRIDGERPVAQNVLQIKKILNQM